MLEAPTRTTAIKRNLRPLIGIPRIPANSGQDVEIHGGLLIKNGERASSLRSSSLRTVSAVRICRVVWTSGYFYMHRPT